MTRKDLFGTLLAMGVFLAAPAAVFGSAGNSAPKPLEDQVRSKLLRLPYYNVFDNISYRVENGTVILAGQVTEPYVKDDAARAVKSLGGVESVQNEIEVLPLSSFDNQIRYNTLRAIYGYGPLQHYAMGTQAPIRIIVKNGNVTLEGVVSNDADRTLAYVRANGVPGVFSVTNDIQVAR